MPQKFSVHQVVAEGQLFGQKPRTYSKGTRNFSRNTLKQYMCTANKRYKASTKSRYRYCLHEVCRRCSQGIIVMLTGRTLYIEEIVIHITANLSWSRLMLCCLHCSASPAWPSGSVLLHKYSCLQHKVSQFAITEEPAGSFHPHLCIKVQQELPKFDSRNDK